MSVKHYRETSSDQSLHGRSEQKENVIQELKQRLSKQNLLTNNHKNYLMELQSIEKTVNKRYNELSKLQHRFLNQPQLTQSIETAMDYLFAFCKTTPGGSICSHEKIRSACENPRISNELLAEKWKDFLHAFNCEVEAPYREVCRLIQNIKRQAAKERENVSKRNSSESIGETQRGVSRERTQKIIEGFERKISNHDLTNPTLAHKRNSQISKNDSLYGKHGRYYLQKLQPVLNDLNEYKSQVRCLYAKHKNTCIGNEVEKLMSLIISFCETKPGGPTCDSDQFKHLCKNYIDTNEMDSLQKLSHKWDVYLKKFNKIRAIILDFYTKLNESEKVDQLKGNHDSLKTLNDTEHLIKKALKFMNQRDELNNEINRITNELATVTKRSASQIRQKLKTEQAKCRNKPAEGYSNEEMGCKMCDCKKVEAKKIQQTYFQLIRNFNEQQELMRILLENDLFKNN